MRIVPERKAKVKVGEEFTRLTVAGRSFYTGVSFRTVVCECLCGSFIACYEQDLRRGKVKSCGCLHLERAHVMNRTHGASSTRLFKIWCGIRKRCNDKGCKSWKNYGGRGITLCEEWSEFPAFRDWALANGYEAELTIERRKNHLGYSPSNCRWVTKSEQARNRRDSVFVTAFGEEKLLIDWARDPRCVVAEACLRQRVNAGVDPEDALTQPTRRR